MKIQKRVIGVLMLSAMVAACGGGSDATTPAVVVTNDPADKYVGNWGGKCFTFDDETSGQYIFALNKTNANGIAGTHVANYYPNPTCTGAGTSGVVEGNFTFSAQIIGSKSMQGVMADKMYATYDGKTYRDVMYADGTTLRVGGAAPYDAQGFSEVWHPTAIFTKR